MKIRLAVFKGTGRDGPGLTLGNWCLGVLYMLAVSSISTIRLRERIAFLIKKKNHAAFRATKQSNVCIRVGLTYSYYQKGNMNI